VAAISAGPDHTDPIPDSCHDRRLSTGFRHPTALSVKRPVQRPSWPTRPGRKGRLGNAAALRLWPCHGRCASIWAVDVAIVGREAEGLRFSDVERGRAGEVEFVWASLRVSGLDASLRISAHYATGFDELVSFFRELAAGWRGWPGERTYESLEHDLRLVATHDGHVRLAVRLRRSTVPDGWPVDAVIRLDPGEEMTRVAEDVAAVLARPSLQPGSSD
jgi:hypothetical protein